MPLGRRVFPIRIITALRRSLCAALHPEKIHLDDWGYPIIDRAEIPRNEMAHAKRAVAGCPVLALALAKERAARPARAR
jgi:ferredoxin